jgi:hypothetical protein
MMRNFNLLPLFFLAFLSTTFAQTGTISGKITDAKTGEEIIGANVSIQGTPIGAPTDLEGKFTMHNIKPDTYNLVVSFITYKTHVIPDVVVEANRISTINVVMQEDSRELEEVVVTGTREISNDFAMIKAIRESKLVVSGISAEQIAKSQDRDAAQVVRRVPGVTLADNRFVIVRGLSTRYSTVLLNGVIAPGTESESRAFSFDIIPSSLLDRMLVYKSGAAELPGEFAGSVILINTKSAVESNFTNFSLSGGYRANTTFQPFKSQPSSSTDFLGFDDGSRGLPTGAPSNYRDLAFDIPRLVAASKKFKNEWSINSMNAVPDFRMSFDLGRTVRLSGLRVSTINSVNYSNTFQHNSIKRFRYTNYDETTRESTPYFEFVDEQYNRNVRLGLLSNWMFRINAKNKIEFRNMYTRIGTTETTLRTGSDIDKGQDVQNYSLHYITRGIYSGQVEGTHESGNNEKSKLVWLAGLTTGNRSEPDWRRVSSRRNMGTENPFQVLVPQNANASDASRFYQDLSEYNVTTKLDFEHKLNATSEPYLIRAGYWGEYKSREFQARSIGYIKASSDFDPAIGALRWNEIFATENIKHPDGLVISENTKYTDTYSAANLLLAAYGSVTMPLSEKVRFIPGIRAEFNHQKLETAPNVTGVPDKVDNPITSVLPFANLSYNLTNSSLLRLAYSKTINRPEFREIAPFSFYDFNFEVDRIGNTDLKIADINNVDFRWEYYPTPAEFISVGTFAKFFRNPIETIIRTGANNPVLQYANARSAVSAGLEIEIRKSLAYSSASALLNNTSVIFNAAYIYSDIDLGDNSTVTQQDRNRPMQGQSPYVINAGLYYQNPDNGFFVSAQYNIFGRRIFSVGDQEFPTIWEMPRHLVDLTVSKRVWKNGELRFGISDLLNSRIFMKEDGNLDGKIEDKKTDKLILDTRNGQYITLGFVLKV